MLRYILLVYWIGCPFLYQVTLGNGVPSTSKVSVYDSSVTMESLLGWILIEGAATKKSYNNFA